MKACCKDGCNHATKKSNIKRPQLYCIINTNPNSGGVLAISFGSV